MVSTASCILSDPNPFGVVVIVLEQMLSRLGVVLLHNSCIPAAVHWPKDSHFLSNHTVRTVPEKNGVDMKGVRARNRRVFSEAIAFSFSVFRELSTSLSIAKTIQRTFVSAEGRRPGKSPAEADRRTLEEVRRSFDILDSILNAEVGSN